MSEFIGSRISLISRSDIRYVGILHEINSENSTVALEQVVSFGTEGRRGDPAKEIPATDNVYEYIVFRGSDVKDLRIEEPAKPKPQIPDDPAILQSTSRPPNSYSSPGSAHYQPAPIPPYYPPNPQTRFGYPPPPYGYPGYPPVGHAGVPPGGLGPGGAGPAGVGQFPPQQQQPQPPQSIGVFPRQGQPPQAPIGPAVNRPQQPPPQPIGPRGIPQPAPQVQPQPPAPAPAPKPVEQAPQPKTPAPPVQSTAPAASATAPITPPSQVEAKKEPVPPTFTPTKRSERTNDLVTPTPTGPKARGGIIPALPLESPSRQAATSSLTPASVVPAPQNTTADTTSAGPALFIQKAPMNLNDTTAAVQDLAHKVSQLKPPSAATPSTTSNAAAPTEQTHRPIRQPSNHMHGNNRGRGGFRGGFQSRKVEVPATDFDFIGSNAKFNKQDLFKEVEEVNAPTQPTNGTGVNGTEKQQEPTGDATSTADGFYSKSKSFFDNISCENKERAEARDGERPRGATWRGEETKKNIETFGQGSVDGAMGGRYGGRGGWRRGRAYRGGYRGRGGSRGGIGY